MSTSVSLIREVGATTAVSAAVTVPLSEMRTSCSGMVSRMWSGVVPENNSFSGRPTMQVRPVSPAGSW